jgi:hypothetical protein
MPARCQAKGGARAWKRTPCNAVKLNSTAASSRTRPKMVGSGEGGVCAGTNAPARWISVQIGQQSSVLEKLQDALGDLNDIAVHAGLTERIVDARDARGKQREGRAKKAFAAGRLSGHEEARIASVLKDAHRAYRAFSRAKPFWS